MGNARPTQPPARPAHPTEATSRDELTRLIGHHIRPRSIMGHPHEVAALESVLGGAVEHIIHYRLLALTHHHFPAPLPPPHPALRIIRPTPRQWKPLLPLQIAYETEEVLLPGRIADPSESRYTLLHSLRTQIVLAATDGRSIIARVATNARGYRYAQLGGVYTAPTWRNRGVARWLLTHLLSRIAESGHHASLFVKEDNPAAQRLYHSLGFEFVSPFMIRYYR